MTFCFFYVNCCSQTLSHGSLCELQLSIKVALNIYSYHNVDLYVYSYCNQFQGGSQCIQLLQPAPMWLYMYTVTTTSPNMALYLYRYCNQPQCGSICIVTATSPKVPLYV